MKQKIFMKTITFLRHGEYQESGKLSDKGITQAQKRANSLKNFSPFDLVVASSAERAKETAEIIIKSLNLDIPLILLEELHWPKSAKDKQSVKRLLKELGSEPLSEYMKHDEDKAWERYAKEAYDALLACILEYKAENVLVVGHGNIINSLGLKINPQVTDLKKMYFSYCEGFTLFQESNNIRFYFK